MTPELEAALFADFPDIFPGGRAVDMRQNLMCFGFECGDGWHGLIRKLCRGIQDALDADSALKPMFRTVQVKEKFGGLRFYVDGGTKAIEAMIDAAGEESERTCEACGAAGSTLVRHGWYKTLCPACADAQGYHPDKEPA
jgi:hypothetical protein